MLGNKWQRALGFTTFGESHGPAVGIVLEDIKPGIRFPVEKIQEELEKRRPGKGDYLSNRQEPDRIKILSGLFNGITTGMPICIIIENMDQRSKDYKHLKDIFRPGHGDFSYYKKFKIYDYRGGGRASGRETISRVIAGTFASEILNDISIRIFPVQIGRFKIDSMIIENIINNNITLDPKKMYWGDAKSFSKLKNYLDDIQSAGDSIGGIVKIIISNLPTGLGDPVFEKLDANLAKSLISIGSIKGVEFGKGFHFADLKGSEANDQMINGEFSTNHAGGILAGISTGQPVEINCVVKPTPSISKSQKTIDIDGNPHDIQINGRHDTCIISRIIPVIRAMINLVLADALSYQKLVTDKTLDLNDYREALDKIDEDILIALKRRNEISTLIGKYKKENQVSILDEQREADLLQELQKKSDLLSLNIGSITEIWKSILEMSKKIQ